jgi:hypothetical protein
MSDVSDEITAVTGIPAIKLADTPEHLHPVMEPINAVLSAVPDDVKHEVAKAVIGHLMTWLFRHIGIKQ